MVAIVCWKWNPIPDVPNVKKKITYTADHVNALHEMVERNVTLPHRFICVTDDPEGIDPKIEIVPLWDDLRKHGGCFTRLVCFKKDFKLFGEKFLSMDLDCVVVGNIDHLLAREEDFVIWGPDDCDMARRSVDYCGSLWFLRAGTNSEVYDTFDPSVWTLNKHGRYTGGTDQRQITKVFKGRKVATFSQKDGIYNFLPDVQPTRRLKRNACIVFFNGLYAPDDPGMARHYKFIREFYPLAGKGERHYNALTASRKQKRIMVKNQKEKEVKAKIINFVLFWWGRWPNGDAELGKTYIERLVHGIRTHAGDSQYKIVLFTDSNVTIKGVSVRTLNVPPNLRWNLKKMFMYSSEANLTTPVICLDLDCIITGSLEPFIRETWNLEKYIITCAGAYRKKRLGGSVVAFKPSDKLENRLWKPILEKQSIIEAKTKGSERAYYQMRFRRKQALLWQQIHPRYVLSYKKDCKNGLPKDARIVRFHGTPRPHEVNDKWVKEFWG